MDNTLNYVEILDALKVYYGMSSKVGHTLLTAFVDSKRESQIVENKRLRDAIVKHRDMFPDEPLSGEHELWKVLDDA